MDITMKIRLEVVINQNEAVTEDQHNFQCKTQTANRTSVRASPLSWGSGPSGRTLRGWRHQTSAADPPDSAAPPSHSSSASSLGGRRAWTACPCAEGGDRQTDRRRQWWSRWYKVTEREVGVIVEDQSGRAAEDTPWLVIKDQREQDFHKHTLSLHALWSLNRYN